MKWIVLNNKSTLVITISNFTNSESSMTMSILVIFYLISKIEKECSLLMVSQISYSLVVILELNSVPEVQYKNVIITDNEKYQQE